MTPCFVLPCMRAASARPRMHNNRIIDAICPLIGPMSSCSEPLPYQLTNCAPPRPCGSLAPTDGVIAASFQGLFRELGSSVRSLPNFVAGRLRLMIVTAFRLMLKFFFSSRTENGLAWPNQGSPVPCYDRRIVLDTL